MSSEYESCSKQNKNDIYNRERGVQPNEQVPYFSILWKKLLWFGILIGLKLDKLVADIRKVCSDKFQIGKALTHRKAHALVAVAARNGRAWSRGNCGGSGESIPPATATRPSSRNSKLTAKARENLQTGSRVETSGISAMKETADRIKVICRDETEMQLVEQTAQKTSTKSARVLRDQLYPVKVDGADRTAVLDLNGNILSGAMEALGKENDRQSSPA